MRSLNMMRLAGGVLIVVAFVGCRLIAAPIGLTAQKRNTLKTASVNGSQRSESATMRGFNRPGTQDVRKEDEGKHRLLVRTETSTAGPKESLHLTLILRNESQSVIYVVERMPSKDFKFQIKDIYGETVAPSARPGLVVDEGKNSLVPVNAGQEVSYIIDLADLYNLASGDYTLTVKKTIFLGDKETIAEVESAPLKLVFKSSK